jgi:1,2-phenylacetyl-CoA epoxidase PaaB subunit
MSKLRENVPANDAELPFAPEGDLQPYVVFTQLKADGPFIYAGWLDAADNAMAIELAVNHYGRDQACTCIWVAPRTFVGGLHENAGAAEQPVTTPRDYQIFTQKNAGDQHISATTIAARSATEAIDAAHRQLDNADDLHNIWAIPADELVSTTDAKLIWDNTDQSYRLARGYSKLVKEKWERIREARALSEYEKDDLKETF